MTGPPRVSAPTAMVSAVVAAWLALTLGACAATPPAASPWPPRPGTTWQVQYTGELGPTDAAVIDLDADVPASAVVRYRAEGKRVLCYVNVGAREDWRADTAAFPDEVVGRPMAGWAGEHWLDVRRHDVLLPLMAARFDACAEKGFDGVDPDNVDGYGADTGFPVTPDDAAAWVRALAALARERGLSIGLKNAPELVPAVLGVTDFAVVEECIERGECAAWTPYVRARKAVFSIEYAGVPAQVCARRPDGFSTVVKDRDLGPGGVRC